MNLRSVKIAWMGLILLGLSLATEMAWAQFVLQRSGTTASLRGIHAVGGGVAWASGTMGIVLRTEDGGSLWQHCAVPAGAEMLDFRGVWAWDANTAVVMSSGPGEQSRLYKTTDGCKSWKLLFTNPDKDGFWDAVSFWDRKHGVILGDPVAGRFVILRTQDGGETWKRDAWPGLEAVPGAGAFAASNSSLLVGRGGLPLSFVTGGRAGAYRYSFGNNCSMSIAHLNPHACDKLWSWEKQPLPLAGGSDGAGAFSVAMQDIGNAGTYTVIVGGDYTKPDQASGTAAYALPSSIHWLAAQIPPHGYRSAVAWDGSAKAWIAVGPNGSDVSFDKGKTWKAFCSDPGVAGNWNALSLPFVVGPKGRIGKLLDGAVKELRVVKP
ncbi:MAG: WD40/YVTN/BNR-like repeat-containing protein [Acidobacteriaceae bacterium]